MILLQQAPEWLTLLFGSLGGGSLVLVIIAILKWIRFKKKDSADTAKTEAESAKIKAEASEIKAKAEVTVADAALKLAQRLSDECDMTKKILEKTQSELDKTIQQLHRVTTQLNFVQKELDEERSKNAVIQGHLNKLTAELEQIKKDACLS